MKKVIFDIETKTEAGIVPVEEMEASVVCLWDSESDQYLSFTEDQFDKMWPYFQKTDMIVTYNGNWFDIPVMQKYAPFDLKSIRHLDLFEEVRQVTGKKLGLGGIAETTLDIGKSGHGLDAVAWWNSGEIQKIIDYCIDDVKVTKAVYDHAHEKGTLKYTDRKTGEVVQMEFDTTGWEEKEEATGMLF